MILWGDKPSLWTMRTFATLNHAFQRKAAQPSQDLPHQLGTHKLFEPHGNAGRRKLRVSKTCNTVDMWLQWSSLLGIQLQGLPAHFEELCGKQETSISICFPHISSKVLSSHLLVQLLGFKDLLSKSVPLILPQTRTSHDCGFWLSSRGKLKLFQSQTTVHLWGPK